MDWDVTWLPMVVRGLSPSDLIVELFRQPGQDSIDWFISVKRLSALALNLLLFLGNLLLAGAFLGFFGFLGNVLLGVMRAVLLLTAFALLSRL